MTEKELSRKTNKQLADLLDEMIHNQRQLMQTMEMDENEKDASLQTMLIEEEISRRLRIEPHITFNDAQFDM